MENVWKKIPRAEKVYFAQPLICLTLIIACIVILALHDANREYWMIYVTGYKWNVVKVMTNFWSCMTFIHNINRCPTPPKIIIVRLLDILCQVPLYN